MYACLHIPSFPLAVLLRDDPDLSRRSAAKTGAAGAPAALVSTVTDPASKTESTRLPRQRAATMGGKTSSTPVLLAVNHAAARHRLTPGLTITRALARCPQLALLTPDPVLEHRHQAELRNFVATLGPDFEATAPGTFLLDLLTLPHAHSAPLDWIEQTLRRAAPLRLPLHLALAPTPDLALLAAHSSKLTSKLSFNPEPEFSVQYSVFSVQTLATLPLSLLNTEHCILNTPSPDPFNYDLLHLWGIKNLGDLAALPRQGLAERLGPEAARLHDILHGKHPRLLTLHRPPQHFQVAQELEHALETLEPLLFLLRRGLDTLCARLASSQRAAIAARLTLTFDDGNLHFRDLRLPEPTCDPATLLRLLHTHLDTVRAPAPVVAWSLPLTPTLPGEAQRHLFERSLRDPNKFADTLARLEALLGPGRLGTPQPLDTHKPDRFEIHGGCGVSPQAVPAASRRGSPLNTEHCTLNTVPASHTALPLKRYRPAIEINVASELRGRHHHPLALLTGPHRGPITTTHGPFPLSGSWWDPHERWQHVEWDLQLANQTLLRLVHKAPHRWLLEGVYE